MSESQNGRSNSRQGRPNGRYSFVRHGRHDRDNADLDERSPNDVASLQSTRSPISNSESQLGQYARCVYKPNDIVEVRLLPGGESDWYRAVEIPQLSKQVIDFTSSGKAPFVGVNPRIEFGGSKTDDVRLARCLVADWDEKSPDDVGQIIDSSRLPPPTLEIASGHGVHGYWRLTEPIHDLAEWTWYQKRLIATVGSDPQICDPPRVMRLPGFFNLKSLPPVRCRVISADPSRVYSISLLESAFCDEPAESQGESDSPRSSLPADRKPLAEPISAIDDLLEKLHNVQGSEPQWSARCPAHTDNQNSLSVGVDKGTILMHCHAGCRIGEILEALDITPSDLYLKPRKSSGQNEKAATPQFAESDTSSALVVELRSDDDPSEDLQPDWNRLCEECERALQEEDLEQLVSDLNVPSDALRSLRIGWHPELQCFTFPEFAAEGAICGISTRKPTGEKRVLESSRRGLYLPAGWRDRRGPILIVEGATDTAALTAMGLAGIGRPNAQGGSDLLAKLLATLPTRSVIVLGEFDPKQDGRWPGRDGAEGAPKNSTWPASLAGRGSRCCFFGIEPKLVWRN
jgi:hypothetical protein